MTSAPTPALLKMQITVALRLEDEFDFQAEALRLRRLEKDQLYPVFSELLFEADSELVFERIGSVLIRLGGAQSLGILTDYIQAGGRYAPLAVATIGRLRMNETLDTVLTLLAFGSARVREAAMVTLVRMHSPAAIAPLYRISTDPNDRLQEEAVKALASLIGVKRTAESARYLVDQLIETDAMPRSSIVEGLQAVDEIFPNTPSIERLKHVSRQRTHRRRQVAGELLAALQERGRLLRPMTGVNAQLLRPAPETKIENLLRSADTFQPTATEGAAG